MRSRGSRSGSLAFVAVLGAALAAGCSTSQPRRYETLAQVERLRAAELRAAEVGDVGEPDRRRRELVEARVRMLVALDAGEPDERQLAASRRVGEAFVAATLTHRRPERRATRIRFDAARRGSSAIGCVAAAESAMAAWDGGAAARLVAEERMSAPEVADVADDLRAVVEECSRAPGA